MRFSIIVPTFNRAGDLRLSLQSLAGLVTTATWEVIVVDNNSTDDTRLAVIEAQPDFPVELRYIFEREQGRSAAMNTGIAAARGDIILTTDDDVHVEPDWMEKSGEALDTIDCALQRLHLVR